VKGVLTDHAARAHAPYTDDLQILHEGALTPAQGWLV
jgi:hypothetical protein